jgi:hypothetical protein
VKTATSNRSEGRTRVAMRVVAKLVAAVRAAGSKRARAWPSAVKMGPARSSALGWDDEPHPAGAEDLILASGLCEPVEAHGGVFGYKDEAGVRHPLF